MSKCGTDEDSSGDEDIDDSGDVQQVEEEALFEQ